MTTLNVKQSHALIALRGAVDARDEAEEVFLARAEAARIQMRAALELGVPVAMVARAGRCSRQRVWQVQQKG